MLKQTTGYGCGVYAVANAIGVPSYVNDQRLNSSINGNNLGQLSKWLQDDGHNMFIDPLYFKATGLKLPKDQLGYKPIPVGENKHIQLPVLIDLKYVKNGKMHLTAGHIRTDGSLVYMDSLRQEIEFTTLSEINKRHYVFGLFCFCDILTGDRLFLG